MIVIRFPALLSWHHTDFLCGERTTGLNFFSYKASTKPSDSNLTPTIETNVNIFLPFYKILKSVFLALTYQTFHPCQFSDILFKYASFYSSNSQWFPSPHKCFRREEWSVNNPVTISIWPLSQCLCFHRGCFYTHYKAKLCERVFF